MPRWFLLLFLRCWWGCREVAVREGAMSEDMAPSILPCRLLGRWGSSFDESFQSAEHRATFFSLKGELFSLFSE